MTERGKGVAILLTAPIFRSRTGYATGNFEGINMRVGRGLAAGTAMMLTAVLTACTGQPATTTTMSATTSSSFVATGTVPTVPNDLASNSAHHSLDVPGEQFALNVDYYLTDYDATAWQTLQPKNVHVSAHLAPTSGAAADAPEVLIGSFSGVTTLLAAMPGLDGLPIAETQQEPNAIAGYLINTNSPYDNVLTIEGFSPSLADRWALLAGDQPLTESGLVAAGVYANRLSFTYRVLVKNNGDSGYHQRIITDSLMVTEAAPAAASSSPTPTPSG